MIRYFRSLTAVLALCSAAFAEDPANPATIDSTAAPANGTSDPAMKDLRRQLVELTARNSISKAKLEELTALNSIFKAKLEAELGEQQRDRLKIEAELGLQQQQFARELAELNKTKQRLELKNTIDKQKRESELQALRQTGEKDNLELTVARNANQRAQLEQQQKQFEMQTEMLNMQLKEKRRQEAQAALHDELARLDAELEVIAKRRKLQDIVAGDVATPATPFEDGVLTVSDRRIALNGAIIQGTADYITRRIEYYNNQSDTPIFLVIDDCPGGSLMQGYRILKAIESSRAPVHVVVKSYAASMAAVITTDAEYSYAYPNAIILHHQPWLRLINANVAETQEWAENMKEWARRLHRKTAERMGLSIDAFYERMYQETVTGDWEEFADEALKLNWVGNIAHQIREEGISEKPTDENPQNILARASQTAETTDTVELNKIVLPPLGPYDFYFLYTGDKRYSWND